MAGSVEILRESAQVAEVVAIIASATFDPKLCMISFEAELKLEWLGHGALRWGRMGWSEWDGGDGSDPAKIACFNDFCT